MWIGRTKSRIDFSYLAHPRGNFIGVIARVGGDAGQFSDQLGVCSNDERTERRP